MFKDYLSKTQSHIHTEEVINVDVSEIVFSKYSLVTRGLCTCCALAMTLDGKNMLAHVSPTIDPEFMIDIIHQHYDIEALKNEGLIYVFDSFVSDYSIGIVNKILEYFKLSEKTQIINFDEFCFKDVGISASGFFICPKEDCAIVTNWSSDDSTQKYDLICKSRINGRLSTPEQTFTTEDIESLLQKLNQLRNKATNHNQQSFFRTTICFLKPEKVTHGESNLLLEFSDKDSSDKAYHLLQCAFNFFETKGAALIKLGKSFSVDKKELYSLEQKLRSSGEEFQPEPEGQDKSISTLKQ